MRGPVSTAGFNPHPASRQDAARCCTFGIVDAQFVSILILPLGRMQPEWWLGNPGSGTVSILILPLGRMQRGRVGYNDPWLGVSILILPLGRMQHIQTAAGLQDLSFQSSSCLSAGCSPVTTALIAASVTGFNPHPASRQDAARAWAGVPLLHPVSILILPLGRMQRLATASAHRRRNLAVSILILPLGRMQPGRAARYRGTKDGFNPHPASRQDAARGYSWLHPTPHGVSILILPLGRMQRASVSLQP